jgi:1,4-alpha-glucan branching enzyme
METTVAVQGMGAIAHAEGVFFRVWAPNADRVFVTGDFNDWSDSADELEPEGDGYWGGNAEAAKPGDQYKFIIHNGDMVLHRNDPYARVLTNSAGNSIVYDDHFDWKNDEFTMAPWNELIIYELHIGSFNVTEPGKPGSFTTAIEKLPYLKNLGINAVEIMPPYEFPGGFSWGYNPSYPFSIESEYGGPDAFKEFIRQCHLNGIAVILDIVFNHFGPSDLDLWKFDGWCENDKGGIYFYNDDRSKTPWGDTRPDYGRSEVRQYLRDNIFLWLEEFRVDGLRFDAVSYITNVNGERDPATDLPEGHTLLKWLNEEVATKFPGRILIAEDMKNSTYVTSHYEDDGLGYSAQWDCGFVYNVRDVLIQPEDEHRDMYRLEEAVLFRFRDDCFSRVVYTESHDETANGKRRVAEEIMPGDVNNWYAVKRSMLGVALVLTVPGIPMLFQGQLMNVGGWFKDNEPIEWSKAKENRGLIAMAKDVIALRKNKQGFSRGLAGQNVRILACDNSNKILSFVRWADGGKGDEVVVVMNCTSELKENYTLNFPSPGAWKLRFNSDWEGYRDDFGATSVHATDANEDLQATISIPPYTTLIFSQDPD